MSSNPNPIRDMSSTNKKKHSNNDQQFEFCEVCRLNHNQGRRHNFFPSHKSSLSTFLTRFQSKLSDVKFFLKSPMHLRPDHAQKNRLWCVFCNRDIVEVGSPFACGNVIEHLASGEHLKRVKGFMWKHGGGMDRVDLFRVSEVDYAKWEKKCNSLTKEVAKVEPIGPVIGPSNDIHNELNAENVKSFQNSNVNSLSLCIPNHVVPLHSYTDEGTQVSSSVLSSESMSGSSCHIYGGMLPGEMKGLKNSTGCMDNKQFSSYPGYPSNGSVTAGVRIATGAATSSGLLNLTRISSSNGALEGNVHTGAPPPWFNATKGELEQRDLVPSKARKSSKLNPKRVGAAWAERRKIEMELERRGELIGNKFDANWLPNFGRVWQSGTRKESRKEFRTEENKTPAEVDKQSEPEVAVPLQPYISKRMRRDTSE